MTTLLTTAEARALLGGIARSTLWDAYGDCREPVTDSARPKIAWNRDKIEKRQRELAKRQRARRSA